MPDVRIYLPDTLYIRLNQETNKSKLVQQLLREHWKGEGL
jgi:hypothetical protein